MDKMLYGVIIRQIPIILSSIVTGATLCYFIGFWLGVVVNAIIWGMLIFLAKIYAARGRGNTDPFRDERYLMNFVQALLGRNK